MHTKMTESLRELQKEALLMPTPHNFKIAEGGMHIIIRPYLNFNAEQMKGVSMGLLFWD